MKRTWIKNARIVNEGKTFHGSIVIENDRIAEVIADGTLPLHPCDEEIDAGGCYLMPGVIDDHVHFRDPGLTHKADMHTETTAAAAGGVTSFMDMPNTTPQTTNLEALEAKFADAATKSVVNYSFYFGATNNNADMLSQNPYMRCETFHGSQYRQYAGRPHGSVAQSLCQCRYADCHPL